MAMRMNPPRQLWGLSFALGLISWGFSALRHGLLQSNAYDLGLFDQWVWLISQGQAPISSMEQVHVLADHGAWLLYGAGLLYRLLPSVQWLLGGQALALSFTAIPLWALAGQAGMKKRSCWLACGLWWLQPVVFNTLLFDVHPETWVMPAFAFALWAERDDRPRLWLLMLMLMLGARDGLVLVIGGMAMDLAWRRRWRWCCRTVSRGAASRCRHLRSLRARTKRARSPAACRSCWRTARPRLAALRRASPWGRASDGAPTAREDDLRSARRTRGPGGRPVVCWFVATPRGLALVWLLGKVLASMLHR